MPRKPKFPPYPKRPHQPGGRARIRLPGAPNHTYLGAFGSPESWAEYQRLLAEWRAGEGRPPAGAGPVRTVEDLAARFLLHARAEYSEQERKNFRDALAPVLRLYGHVAAGDFGPRAFKAVQRAAADGTWLTAEERAGLRRRGGTRGLGWCRTLVNRHTSRIKTVFRWAVSEELVPAAAHEALRSVRGLKEGQARERPAVPPVAEGHLQKTLPQLHPVPRALVETLLLTAARPGELLGLTPADLNRSGEVEVGKNYRVRLGEGMWAYQPRKHKTSRHGHQRVILFGPRAQAVLAPLLEGRADDAPVFRPAEASGRPRRRPGERFTCSQLDQFIYHAADRAGVPRWSVYQLRHSAATRVLEQFDAAIAKTILGHRTFAMLATYALDDLKKAADAAREAG